MTGHDLPFDTGAPGTTLFLAEVIGWVREAGARNVAIADGLMFAERPGGAPDLRDPTGPIAYAAHPYAHHREDQAEPAWDAKSGVFARTRLVIVTEQATVPNIVAIWAHPDMPRLFSATSINAAHSTASSWRPCSAQNRNKTVKFRR